MTAQATTHAVDVAIVGGGMVGASLAARWRAGVEDRARGSRSARFRIAAQLR